MIDIKTLIMQSDNRQSERERQPDKEREREGANQTVS